MATYVVSDLHGQYGVFREGLKKIGFGDNDSLYVLGDVIDRGDDGIKILQYIKRKKNIDLLLGNHEYMMLNSVDPDGGEECCGEDAELWILLNGGLKTYNKYMEMTRKSRKAMLTWLRNRYVIRTLEAGGRKFCLTHSYYIENCEDKRYKFMRDDDVWQIVWKSVFREERGTHGEDIYKYYDYTFITGHVPVQKVRNIYAPDEDFNILKMYKRGNLIDIDGGCAYGGNKMIDCGALFIRLDDMKAFPIAM